MSSALPAAASVRRVLGGAVLACALLLSGASSGAAAECAPDDQVCKDNEANAAEAKEIEEQQQKTKESAAQADKDIKKVGADLEKCKPGSETCMAGLAKGNGEKEGLADMTAAVQGFQPDPKDNAQSAVTSTCADFPALLPEGSTDPGQTQFPVSQLCKLLGS
ncbi:hypothetical protein [Streptomyces sp. NPDC051921]|uniref:hypothetical protein n=1 Tax=Streptomyces sp. NPDC051921 TaxID=3155806 RepID=UPI0034376E54